MARKSALIIVDVQNDFVDGGSLAVPEGRSVVASINALEKSHHWDLIVASKDWHPWDHVSFASNHKGQHAFELYQLQSVQHEGKQVESTLWPDHCVQGSEGAELVKGLDISHVNAFVLKGEQPGVEFYSAFKDVFGDNSTNLLSLLREHKITDVVVVGLAFDFCVKHTALDAARYGFATEIDLNCTKAITPEGETAAEKELREAGVKLVHGA